MLDLRVWPGQVADGCIPSATPGKGPKQSNLYRLNKVGYLLFHFILLTKMLKPAYLFEIKFLF